MTNVLILGSYNGQDSLGDYCLLRTVLEQIRIANKDAAVTVHLNDASPRAKEVIRAAGAQANWGLQSLFWRWRTKWRHSRLPLPIYRAIAGLLFPAYFAMAALVPGSIERRIFEQVCRADVIYIYGGTNFSRRWYWINTQYLVLTMLLGRLSGASVVLGPQQYGPMTRLQRRFTRLWIKFLVTDYYLRNAECLEQLKVPSNEAGRRLLWDEVYSNIEGYPTVPRHEDAPQYILLNIRGGNLADESSYDPGDLAVLGSELSGLQRHYGLPIRWFGVSGESFCDDAAGARLLQIHLTTDSACEPLEISDEYQLIEAARKALVCVSMSFHGCILCKTAGIPSVPIVDGPYYEYKYADFDRYGDGQRVPRVRLHGDCADLGALIGYIDSFDARAAGNQRLKASEAIRNAYSLALVETSKRRLTQL